MSDKDKAFVVFFKESGKYYTEEMIDMPYKEDGYIVDYFKECLKKHLSDGRLKGMIAVCMEPNHKDSYPLMVKVDSL